MVGGTQGVGDSEFRLDREKGRLSRRWGCFLVGLLCGVVVCVFFELVGRLDNRGIIVPFGDLPCISGG